MYLIRQEYDLYPRLLPFSGTQEEILEQARKELVFTSTTMMVDRKLDTEELQSHRDAYTQIKETDEVELKSDIIDAKAAVEQAKGKLKELEERYTSMLVEIDDHVRMIYNGFVSETLIPERSVAIVVNNMKLHYTATTSGLELAYVEPFAPSNANLFENQEHNQAKFKEWFNVDYTPETDFEIIKVANAEGRTCARNVSTIHVDELLDEETGEIVPIDRTNVILKASDIVTKTGIEALEAENIEKIVVYAKISTQEGQEE